MVARTPALWLAEIAWRWTFGLGSLLFVCLACLQFTRSIHVSNSDLHVLRSGDPFLVAGTLAGILHDTAALLLRILTLLVPAIAVLWTFAAALGRAATLNVLLRHPAQRFWSLLGLSFLRATLTLAAIVAFFGSGMLAGYRMEPTSDPQRAIAQAQAVAAAFLVAGLVIAIVWALLNWLLALATVFAVRDRCATVEAVAEAVRVCRRNLHDFLTVSTWFGFWRAVLLVVAVIATGGVLAAAGSLTVAIVAVALITVVYFALVDFLYIARLAAYVAIIEGPPEAEMPAVPDKPTNSTALKDAQLHEPSRLLKNSD
ncbi:MAG: hypothetical protein ACE14L_06825 [Terriglobales bacterium]